MTAAVVTKQILSIIRDTFLKREPKQSSTLAADQLYRISAGTQLEIHSYAYADGETDFSGHVRFALKDQKINGFNTWYVYGTHIEISFNGEHVYPQEEEGARFVLEIDKDTVLKQRPVDASELAANEKVAIAKGKTLELHSYAFKDANGPFKGHFKFAIADDDNFINNLSAWYVSEQDAHVELNDEQVYPVEKSDPAPTVEPAPTPNPTAGPAKPAPSPAASKPPAPAPAKPAPTMPPVIPTYAAKSIKLPDGRTVSITNAIMPGGSFTWGHATHAGQRVPQNAQHLQNIIKLATELEKVRKQFASKTIRVTSWYRPEPWNSRVGGARRSQHLTGSGVDITIPGLMGNEVGKAVMPTWKGGLGIYPGNRKHILHLDIGPKRKWGF